MKLSELICIGIIVISFAIGIYFYPQMPEQMASHWGARGEVNGYMPTFWGLFLMPIISIVMLLLFILIPKIDPYKANIAKFRKYFDGFVVLLIAFLFYIYILSIAWNMGFRFNMVLLLVPSLAILFFYAGVLIENAKRNWFIGIRTPWTLSNEKVWEKTHKLGGSLFKICGIIAILGIFLEKYAIYIVIVPIIVVSLYLMLYSYLEFQKIKKK